MAAGRRATRRHTGSSSADRPALAAYSAYENPDPRGAAAPPRPRGTWTCPGSVRPLLQLTAMSASLRSTSMVDSAWQHVSSAAAVNEHEQVCPAGRGLLLYPWAVQKWKNLKSNGSS